MASKKAGGSAKNLRDSNPKYLGTKLYDGEKAKIGFVLVRQRGTVLFAGKNVGMGKDHTLFALKSGTVKFTEKKRIKFNNKTSKRKFINII